MIQLFFLPRDSKRQLKVWVDSEADAAELAYHVAPAELLRPIVPLAPSAAAVDRGIDAATLATTSAATAASQAARAKPASKQAKRKTATQKATRATGAAEVKERRCLSYTGGKVNCGNTPVARLFNRCTACFAAMSPSEKLSLKEASQAKKREAAEKKAARTASKHGAGAGAAEPRVVADGSDADSDVADNE